MDIPTKNKYLDETIQSAKQIFFDATKISDEYGKTGDRMLAIAQMIRKDSVRKKLREISVENLSDYKKGIRVARLKEAGITNFSQLAQLSKNRLKQIDGIGEKQASDIFEIVNSVSLDIESTVRLKIDASQRDENTEELLRLAYIYLKNKPYLAQLDKILHKYSQKVSQAITIASKGKSAITRFFMGSRQKSAFTDACDDLYRWSANGLFEDLEYLVSQIRKTEDIRARAVWREYQENPIPIIGCIEDFIPIFFEKKGYLFGLDGDLVEDILVNTEGYNFSGMKCSLRKYQLFGAKYILNQGNVLLGDEMGLGKTIQALAAITALANAGETHFVAICPASILMNWFKETESKSSIQPFLLHGGMRLQAFEHWKEHGGLAITTYETLPKLPFLDLDFKLAMCVVDEAHFIKNQAAKRTRNVLEVCDKASRCLFMTGTPLENYLGEMTGLICVLRPDMKRELFRLSVQMQAVQYKRYISTVYYRRKVEDVLGELPPLSVIDDWQMLCTEEIEDYVETLRKFSFHEMRQVSWLSNDTSCSTKATRLKEIVAEAHSEGRKVVVFSFYLHTINVAKEIIGEGCYGPIFGGVPPKERQAIIDEFEQDADAKALVCQINTAGFGLNMQKASVAILCEPQVKPSLETQAIARLHRMGQTNSVVAYRLLARNTFDERMVSLEEEKQRIFDLYADESIAAKLDEMELSQSTINDMMNEERKMYGIY